jgi:glyoxylase-like metal-dependent hydrolase (beta-lactamase superfamily II)
MTAAATLAPGLVALRAANPSPLTGPGTNTYVIGQDELAVIDPGPDLYMHHAAILGLARGRRITRIVVTHAHLDHSALVPRLAAATGAEVLAFGDALDGISPRMADLSAGLSATGEGLDLGFTPDRRLADGETVEGPDWTLRAIHTPGHLGSHICLAWGDLLFSGDHVMGWSTSLVSPPEGDMGDYMQSLHRLAASRWNLLLPGHGDPVRDPAARIAELIAHRLQREAQILQALSAGPATPVALTAMVYRDTPRTLWPAAARNVLAHLLDLEDRSLVVADPSPGPNARFHLV